MNRINQLFNSNKKDILSIYFCAGDPALDGTVNVIRTLEKHGVSMIEIGIPVIQWRTVLSSKTLPLRHYETACH